jgi:hypothetical protein
MKLKDEMEAYQIRWAELDAVIAEERRSASLELRWQQLNAACAMAIGLGLSLQESDESEVFARWAKLKEKATSRSSKV